MPEQKRITDKQIKIIWAIAKKDLRMERDDLYALIFALFESERMTALTWSKAELLIRELKRRSDMLAFGRLTSSQYQKIKAMAREMGWNAERLQGFTHKTAKVQGIACLSISSARDVIAGMEKIRKSWLDQQELETRQAAIGLQ